ncbi:MAG: bifunctional phosphopantothenoylcysteine decarboxylase/phosphopantothenate--cysteine ligase CoaBC [Candidatus Pelagibacter sp.]|nr:bifunctional phosphopantothenoylcysteine decarboxylase/phosphopantothenate--cysteine ligase CoaBC [Candidatus Pelagibacter sp.]OUV98071.1 MAG: phosphopantothenate synthase [Candidatus Pelagibacter sp. TMED142]|tara:strand:- start:91 stop:1305 length:1215 start_codon:yes stop_codon:yes gene_type:complete
MSLKNKKILLIITGGISAYKNLDLISNLKKQGVEFKIILTQNAKNFVTPLSLAALSKNKIYNNEFSLNDEIEMDHIALSRWSDLILICPATANIICELAQGSAKNLINTVVLASNKKIFIVPGMNTKMWENEINQENVKKLKNNGFYFLGPDYGELACGEIGLGKMSKLSEIEIAIKNFLYKKSLNLNAVITAGPTREYLDPVRYLSNESSGLQGYEIAKKMVHAGINTKLIIGPSNIKLEDQIPTENVTSTQEMFDAVKNSLPCDVMICCAAVSDFKFKKNLKKLKKNNLKNTFKLESNPDILNYISNLNHNRPKLVIGFAAETDNLVINAKKKLEDKRCDWIVANDISNNEIGFNSTKNAVTIIYDKNHIENLPIQEKSEIAGNLVNRIIKKFNFNDVQKIN